LLGKISQNNNLRNKVNINSCNLLKSIVFYNTKFQLIYCLTRNCFKKKKIGFFYNNLHLSFEVHSNKKLYIFSRDT